MTRLRPLHTLLLLLGALSAGAAEPLVPGQFAQGFAIEAMQDGAIHRLALDERVYRALQRPDLGDLVVFNGSGEAVPQALEPASVPAAAETVERPLPFYPVGDDTSAETRSGLQVTVNTAGAVVSIAAPAAGTETVATPSWIIDAGENHAALRALRLQWSDATEPFLRPVTLYASSDLRGWNYQLQATLADLAHDGHQLRRDTLEFWGAAGRFLRIDWGGGAAPVQLLAAIGRMTDAPQPLPRSYSSARGQLVMTPQAGWQFDTGGSLPVDRLRMQLPGDNNLVELRVWSRAIQSANWIERGRALAYRLSADGAVLESPEIELPLTRDRYWRLEPTGGDTRALGDAPEILLGWLPDTLLFVARGTGPYTLGAGSATGVAATQPVVTLLGTMGPEGREQIVAQAWIGEAHALGGEQALRVPEPPVPWQRYLMWALLIGGVLVLLRMALSLLRG